MKYYGFKSVAKFPRSNNKRLGFAGGMAQVIKALFANNEQGFAFDFNDLSTMYQDSAGTIPVTGVGQPVGKVLDKSGRGNHAIQSTSSKRPVLQKNATTGAYYLSFDGVDDYLVTGNINATSFSNLTIFSSVMRNTDSVTGMIAEFSASSDVNNSSFYIASPLTPSSAYKYSVKGGNGVVVAPAAAMTNYPLKTNNILTLKSDLTNGVASMTINGKLVQTLTGGQNGNYGNYPLYIGARNGASILFNGNLYSLIGIARLATATEITNTESIIAKNVGVTL